MQAAVWRGHGPQVSAQRTTVSELTHKPRDALVRPEGRNERNDVGMRQTCKVADLQLEPLKEENGKCYHKKQIRPSTLDDVRCKRLDLDLMMLTFNLSGLVLIKIFTATLRSW
jgi:hypothetical protein